MKLIAVARRVISAGLILIAVLSAVPAFAGPGVGVSPGSIAVNDRLKPGGAYDLPLMGVINTGDEAREYGVSIGVAASEGLAPKPEWFHFEPASFVLEPGESRAVETRIVLPTGAGPGDYAAQIEAYPVTEGNFSVGVAAATKLTFSVEPASWFQAQRHRLNRWLDDMAPWTYIAPLGLLAVFLVLKARKLPYRVRLERK